jgi:hypothetical protein
VLDRRRDAGLAHAFDERHDVRCDDRRVAAVLALELADRSVLCRRAGGNDVSHRREVQVHARGEEMPTPRRHCLKVGRLELPLGDCGGDRAETQTSQCLDQATFLVGGHEEADSGGRVLRGKRLDRVCDLAHARDTDRGLGSVPDRSEMVRDDRPA